MYEIIENNLKNIINSLPSSKIDGKELMDEMKKNNQQYKQLEYQAFYFEDYINEKLDKNFEEKKFKNGNSTIDNFYQYPIDIKTHNIKEGNLCVLNDGETIEKAINDYGAFGAIVLNIDCDIDEDYSLRNYQKELSGKSSYKNTSGKHRKIKKSFEVKSIDFFEIKDKEDLKVMNQGKNSNGKRRKFKYSLDTNNSNLRKVHIDK